MLPVPVKIYPFEIFTRVTPGSSLVEHNLLTINFEIIMIELGLIDWKEPTSVGIPLPHSKKRLGMLAAPRNSIHHKKCQTLA